MILDIVLDVVEGVAHVEAGDLDLLEGAFDAEVDRELDGVELAGC